MGRGGGEAHCFPVKCIHSAIASRHRSPRGKRLRAWGSGMGSAWVLSVMYTRYHCSQPHLPFAGSLTHLQEEGRQ